MVLEAVAAAFSTRCFSGIFSKDYNSTWIHHLQIHLRQTARRLEGLLKLLYGGILPLQFQLGFDLGARQIRHRWVLRHGGSRSQSDLLFQLRHRARF